MVNKVGDAFSVVRVRRALLLCVIAPVLSVTGMFALTAAPALAGEATKPVNEESPHAEAEAPQEESSSPYDEVVGAGTTLTCDTGAWTGTEPITYTYQWEVNYNEGAPANDWSEINEAESSQLITTTELDGGDPYVFLRCTVTARNEADVVSAHGNNYFRLYTRAPEVGMNTLLGPSGPLTEEDPGSTADTFAKFRLYASGQPSIALPTASSFECSFDGATLSPCTSPVEYTELAPGEHTLKVVVTNVLGTESAPETVYWDVVTLPENTVAPHLEAAKHSGQNVGNNDLLTCNKGVWTGSPTFAYQWEEGSSFEGEFTPISGATDETLTTTSALNGKFVRCDVTATNEAGEASGPTNELKVEAVAPTVEITTKPESRTASDNAELAFSAHGNANLGIGAVHGVVPACGSGIEATCTIPVTTKCRLDEAELATCTSPKNYTGLSDGEHTFEVVATDQIGNTASATYSWTIVGAPENTAAPRITGPIKRGRVGNAQTLTCNPGTWSGEEDEFSYQWYENENAIGGATTTTLVTSPSENGVVLTCKVTVKNIAGELTRTSVNGALVEAESPKVAITTKPPAHTTSTSAELAFIAELGFNVPEVFAVHADNSCPSVTASASCCAAARGSVVPAGACEEPNLTVECRLDSAALAPCTSPQSFTGLALGEHTFEVVATDFLGNKTSVTYSWVVEKPAEAPKEKPKEETKETPPTSELHTGETSELGGATVVKEEKSGGSFSVECSLSSGEAGSCEVSAFEESSAPTGSVADAAAHLKKVGSGKATGGHGRKIPVKVHLTKSFLDHLRTLPGGVRLKLKSVVTTTKGYVLHPENHVHLVAATVTLTPGFGEFEYESPHLGAGTVKYLRQIHKAMGQPKGIVCAGHTDVGPTQPDYVLGLERAKNVCGYLRGLGVRAHEKAISYGFSMLLLPEGTPQALLLNRYVTITIHY